MKVGKNVEEEEEDEEDEEEEEENIYPTKSSETMLEGSR